MSYGEWCQTCGAEIVSVTRGIPSMGTCANGHRIDRRDALRREPSKPEMVSRSEAEAMVAAALREASGVAFDAVFDEMNAVFARNTQRRILALIPQPASVALDKLIAEAVMTERERSISIAASLAAAISLLERGGKAAKKAAPSDKMFDQMLVDYRTSLEAWRAAKGDPT